MADITKKLARVLAKHQDLLHELQMVLCDPQKANQLERVQKQIVATQAEQARLMQELQVQRLEATEEYQAYGNLARQRPMREQVLDILNELKVVTQPRTISEFASVVYNYSLSAARFASLRRDEERAYRKEPTSRPAWICPAINTMGLTAIPRYVAVSTWSAENRLIGSRTLRTNHLRVLLALLHAKEYTFVSMDNRDNKRLEAMISRYALTVPGALEFGEDIDLERIREATMAELARIEPEDLEERRAVAADLEKLPEPFRLWGKPVLIDAAIPRGVASNDAF